MIGVEALAETIAHASRDMAREAVPQAVSEFEAQRASLTTLAHGTVEQLRVMQDELQSTRAGGEAALGQLRAEAAQELEELRRTAREEVLRMEDRVRKAEAAASSATAAAHAHQTASGAGDGGSHAQAGPTLPPGRRVVSA